jgi:Lipocalin-like domain
LIFAKVSVQNKQIVPVECLPYDGRMNHLSSRIVVNFALAAMTTAAAAQGPSPSAPSLAGTWSLVAADDLRPDGTRHPAYGASPRGLLVLTPDGRYSLQLFRSDRPRFASGDKKKGTTAEYEAAVLGMSSHVGRYAVDAATRTLTFRIELASFPNWEGTEQKRPFDLSGDELSYRVVATPDGTIPISVWRRVR